MFMIMLAADLALGFLVGLLTRMRTDEDYAAWHALKKTNELVATLEKRVSEFVSAIEIAKKRCMAGIVRAQNIRSKRHDPSTFMEHLVEYSAIVASEKSQTAFIGSLLRIGRPYSEPRSIQTADQNTLAPRAPSGRR